MCATIKPRMGIPPAPLQPLEVEDLFDRLQIDHMGPLSWSSKAGNNHVLVMTECLSNYTIAVAVPDTSPERTAEELYQRVICIYGTPKIIQSDNAQGFNSKLMTELLKILEAKKVNSSGYAQRTQRCVEKRNKDLMRILRRTIQEKKDSWDQHLFFL